MFRAAREADRALLTLDTDFSNPLRFPPESGPGVVVLHPHRSSLPVIRSLLAQVAPVLTTQDCRGRLFSLQEEIRRRGLTQMETARALGVTQPRISHLMNGRIDLVSTDMLIDLLARLGLRVRLSVPPYRRS